MRSQSLEWTCSTTCVGFEALTVILSDMAGYGSLGGRGSQSIVDRVQDAFLSIASSLPCNTAALTDLCNSLAGAGGSSSSAGGVAGGLSGTMRLNGRNVQIVKLLGEGGFSFVYLARDRDSGREFALKQIRCPAGSEALSLAMAEMESHRRFKSPYIMSLLDSAVVQEADGKTVYLFLPFHPMGNVQDYVNRNYESNKRWDEASMLEVFLGACKGVKEMHRYRYRGESASSQIPEMNAPSTASNTQSDSAPLLENGGAGTIFSHEDDEDDDDDDDDGEHHTALNGKDDNTQRGSYPPRNEFEQRQPRPGKGELGAQRAGEVVPYAHRDIKPGNIMLSQASGQEGEPTLHPTLMDFGSACKARVHIKTRRQAVAEQDVAAERSTMPYRAPELFDIKTDTTLTEAVDIWSLGCTLYCMMYSYSPFETPTMMEQGGNVAMAVLQNNWKFPAGDNVYGQASKTIIERCLVTKAEDRADIEELISLTEEAMRQVA